MGTYIYVFPSSASWQGPEVVIPSGNSTHSTVKRPRVLTEMADFRAGRENPRWSYNAREEWSEIYQSPGNEHSALGTLGKSSATKLHSAQQSFFLLSLSFLSFKWEHAKQNRNTGFSLEKCQNGQNRKNLINNVLLI